MSWSPPPGSFGYADPLLLLLLALAAEAYLGDRALLGGRIPHPRHILSALVGGVERRLDKAERGQSALAVRGLLVALGVTLGAALLGGLIALVTRFYPFAWVLEVFLLMLLVAQRATWQRTASISVALLDGSLIRAREALRVLAQGRIPGERLEAFDEAGICAAAIPALADRFGERLVAPVFWYALLGLPGIFVQQAVGLAAARLGRGRAAADCGAFARPLARLDEWLAFLPGRLAGILLAAAATAVGGGRLGAALRRLQGSRNWPRAALVSGLGLVAEDPAAVTSPDLKLVARALRVFVAACLINAGLVTLVLLLGLVL